MAEKKAKLVIQAYPVLVLTKSGWKSCSARLAEAAAGAT